MTTHTQPKRTILAVDDDDVNLMILVKTCKDSGFAIKPFSTGQEAWDYLTHNAYDVDIVLLDKMMPGLGGMELLGYIKRHPTLKHIPVIIQTGDVGTAQICEGLENGAYYYLAKPFPPEVLIAILHAAESECKLREEMLSQMVADQGILLATLQEGEFTFNSYAKARLLAVALARVSAKPELVARGLMELFSNAIEHGSLGIGLETKKNCLLNKRWQQEVMTRLSNPEYKNRSVSIQVQKILSSFHVVITDQGKGFDWRHYMSKDARKELNSPNGRGIAIAKTVLEDLQFNGKGNEVQCNIGISAIPSFTSIKANVIEAAYPQQLS